VSVPCCKPERKKEKAVGWLFFCCALNENYIIIIIVITSRAKSEAKFQVASTLLSSCELRMNEEEETREQFVGCNVEAIK